MSQAPTKTTRPSLSLSNPGGKKRPGTPSSASEKSDSRSSTPQQPQARRNSDEQSLATIAARSKPKPVAEKQKQEPEHQNGASSPKKEEERAATNGTNGTTAAATTESKTTVQETSTESAAKAKKAPSISPKTDTAPPKPEEVPRESPKTTPKKKGGKSTPVEQTEQPVVEAPPPVNDVTTKEKAKEAKEKAKEAKEKDVEEMESLVFEAEIEDSPMPKPTGRVLRLASGTPQRTTTAARASPISRKSDRLQNASTIVNLSTVSEQSVEMQGSPRDSSPMSYREIGGRRSVRPIKDIQFSYRLNESISSMNATVGSEIHNDSLRTPIASVKGRKRREGDSELEQSIDTPTKRSRLDVSGFLGFVVSPVTMLRSRISSFRLASTPNKAVLDKEEAVVNVSGTEEGLKDAGVDVTEGAEAVEQEVDEIKLAKAEAANVEGEIQVKEIPPRRSICVVM